MRRGVAELSCERYMWISIFPSKQGKLYTVVPLVIHGAWPLEDLSAFAGVLLPWQVTVHVNNR